MKHFYLLLETNLLLLVVAIPIFAQNTPQPPPTYRPEVQKGTWNTGFTYNPGVSDLEGLTVAFAPVYQDEFTFNKVPLMGIAAGYFFNDGWEVGGGVNFGSHPSEGETSTGIKFDQTENHFGIGAYLTYHIPSKFEPIDPFIGIVGSYGSISGDRTDTNSSGQTFKSETSGNSFGAGLTFGTNLYVTDGFAFTGAYNFGWLKLDSPELKLTNNGTTTTTTGPSSSWFGTNNFELGVKLSF